jgi:ATP-dependent helicase/nuclease subunit B
VNLHFARAGRFECAVIVRSLESCHATLARVFRRYGIPFFLDRRESVSHHPLAELTRFAVRTAAFGWRHDDWFGALKSGLVPAREDDLDWLENAALQFGWQGNAWQQTITLPVNASLAERAEHLRQKIIRPFAALAQQVAAPITGAQLGDALRELWSSLDVQTTLERWATGDTDGESPIAHRREPRAENLGQGTLAIGDPLLAIHQTVWDQAESWLENLGRAFSTDALSLRDWLPILEAGLANLTVGVIPPALDQVLIGAIDRSRNPDLKLALVLGLNEEVFPAPPAPGALLTDADRAVLGRQDVFLARPSTSASAASVTTVTSPARAPASGWCSRAPYATPTASR